MVTQLLRSLLPIAVTLYYCGLALAIVVLWPLYRLVNAGLSDYKKKKKKIVAALSSDACRGGCILKVTRA